MTKKLLMANEAFAHAALESGARVVAGYPGTPSSEVIETIAKLHADGSAKDVHVEWSTNEKTALEVVAGASLCGARTLFTCKQMGLNVASDPLMCMNYIGVKGGTVLFVADDPGPISSQTEQDTRRFAAFAKLPVFDPATPEQGFSMIKAAFGLSEKYHTPVIVRPTTRICHASTFFDVQEETHGAPLLEGGFEKKPEWVIFPARAWAAHKEILDRLDAIANEFATNPEYARFNAIEEGGTVLATVAARSSRSANRIVAAVDDVFVRQADDEVEVTEVGHAHAANDDLAAGEGEECLSRIGIAAGGVSVQYTLEALDTIAQVCEEAGVLMPAYRFMQVGTPYPFPTKTALAFAEGVQEVLVLEELDSVIEEELIKLGGEHYLGWTVRGRLSGDARTRGENTVEDIASHIACVMDRFLAESEAHAEDGVTLTDLVNRRFNAVAPQGMNNGEDAYTGPLPVRPPVLCAGCPHRGSFYALKRALKGKNSVFCGDIGCYTLGNAAPLNAVDTCLCMGAGVTMAQGFSIIGNEQPDVAEDAGAASHAKCVAFIGDSTFFASGLTGIANAVYNGHDVTFVILDNATTAMTGAQPHPGTGVTLMGEKRLPIDIEAVLRGLGVECVVTANPLVLDEAIPAAQEALDFEGPSALIYQSPCVQLFAPGAPVAINEDECTGCKRCITEIGCPAIGFSPLARGPRSGERGQAFIDNALCNGCQLCVTLCPTGAIQAPAGEEASR